MSTEVTTAPSPKKKKAKKRSIKKIILFSVIGLLVCFIGVQTVAGMLRGPAPTYVNTQAVSRGEIHQTLSSNGVLQSNHVVVVSSPVSAPVESVLIQQGQVVTAGDKLVTYDPRLLQRAYQQAAAAYESGQLQKTQAVTDSDTAQTSFNDAATNLNNVAVQKDTATALVNTLTQEYAAIVALEGEASPNALAKEQQLTAAQSDLAHQLELLSAAKAAYDTLEQSILTDNQRRELDLSLVSPGVSVQNAKEEFHLAEDGVTAPISGVVSSLTAVQGVSSGIYSPLCTIESLTDVSVDISLSRYDLEKVQLNQTATILTLGKTYTGKVTFIDAMATSGVSSTGASTTYVHAKIKIDNPDDVLKLGLDANVEIATGSVTNVLTVPNTAVCNDVSGQFCYITENGIAVRRDVTVGLSADTLCEVTSGLQEGDEVILNPQDVTEGIAVSNDAAYAVADTATMLGLG